MVAVAMPTFRGTGFLAFLLVCTTTPMPGCSSTSSAPWQTVQTNVLDEKEFGDLPANVFAPGGRLYSVERTLQETTSIQDKSANLVVALQCRDGTVIVSTSRMSPNLHTSTGPSPNLSESDSSSLSSLDSTDNTKNETGQAEWEMPLWLRKNTISNDQMELQSVERRSMQTPVFSCFSGALVATGGNAVDSSLLQRRIESIAEFLQEENDGGHGLPQSLISSAFLSRRLADNLQEATQTRGKMLASSALIFGQREPRKSKSSNDKHPRTFPFCMWRIDPTGQFWDCDAAAIGQGARVAEAHLLSLLAKTSSDDDNEIEEELVLTNANVNLRLSELSTEEAFSLACQCIAKALKLSKDGTEYNDQWNHMQGLYLKPVLEQKDSAWTIQTKNGKELFQSYQESSILK